MEKSEKEKQTDSFLQAKWRNLMSEIQKGFPSPWKEIPKDQIFENTFGNAISEINKLKHNRFYEEGEALRSYLGQPELPDYSKCKDAVMNLESIPHDKVIEDLVQFFVGMPNWGHPQTMCNVNPPANIASIIGATLSKVFSPDIMEGEYSWNVAKVEIESGAMLAEMMGWDREKAGGVYTFSGTMSYLYALKLAISSVLGQESRKSGVRRDGQLLVADSGHYAKFTCADWTGLGINNIRTIPVNSEGVLDVRCLREEMQKCKNEGKPVVMIVCTLGTTDAFAIDPIAEIRAEIDAYENADGCPKPLLYADAVIGWSWMSFKNYNFAENPLEFSKAALAVIKRNYEQIAAVSLADAMGIDFHKTGWAPYNSSFFLVKDYSALQQNLNRTLPPYLQFSTSYNPFIFTLETSRGAAGACAGWASMKFFGYEGYQVMLGRIIEITIFFRKLLQKEKNIVCVNPDNYGFVNLFRVYPKHIDAYLEYEKELNNPEHREALCAYNRLQVKIANKLFAMLREPDQKIPGWESPPYTSLTRGYRAPTYAPNEQNTDYLVYALKAFPMSPFSNELSILLIRNYVLKARDLVIEEILEQYSENDSKEKADDAEEQAHHRKWCGDEEPIPLKYLIPEKKMDIDILKEVTLFSQLTPYQLNELIESSKVLTLNHGDILFNEGDMADNAYVILEGKVRIYKKENLEKEIDIAILDKGDFFGEMAVFASGTRTATVCAIGKCKLLVISGPLFIKLLF